MAWRRIGFVYGPDGSQKWARSHAALPTPLNLRDNVFRIFFSARDADKRSHVGWVDLEVSENPCVVAKGEQPVLSPGQDGAFDDSGVSIGSIVLDAGKLRLYYMGWNLGLRSPWRNAIGLAETPHPDAAFVRLSAGPILDRSPEDPYTLSYPWVMRDGADWRMWYGSNLTAAVGTADTSHTVKQARSDDGIRWARDGKPLVAFEKPNEYAIARPSVVKTDAGWLMAYSCRGDRYCIMLSASSDSVSWMRIPSAGLRPSPDGWDSEMTCYPALFTHAGRLWMVYNGNGYGTAGFGLAVWDGPAIMPVAAR